MQTKNYEKVFKDIDDSLRNDSGCGTELDYTEQSSWILFLKYLDSLEEDKKAIAILEGKVYEPVISKEFKWESWASPKDKSGTKSLDFLTGEDLIEFINTKLFPYLRGFKESSKKFNTIEYKIGEIFSEIQNKLDSGYNLREIINNVDELEFRSQKDKYQLSMLYEEKIKRMGNAGRNGGEYYTPRPLIRSIIKVIDPRIGEKIYDPSVGSAGFLCEAFDYLRNGKDLNTKELDILQNETFTGKEKKSLAYVIAIMNLILHGLDAPNIIRTNTLSENLQDIDESKKYDVILANPPFGGNENASIKKNFDIRSNETALLFLQHFIKMLKAGGRAGVVIKNTFLSNTDKPSINLRRTLLETCNLHTILVCPKGTFQGTANQTVVLFFNKGQSTKKIWYYELNPGRNLGKSNPLNDNDLQDFLFQQKNFSLTKNSWFINSQDVEKDLYDLYPINPNYEEPTRRNSNKIVEEIENLDLEMDNIFSEIKELI